MSAGQTATPELPAPGQLEIHIWRINLLQDAAEEARLETCLSPTERERAARFHFARDRRRFVIRRAVLRHLLGACLGVRSEAVHLLRTPHGKPFLEGQESPDGFRFSCSHSADLGLIAIARGCEVGVDLERHQTLANANDMANAFFSSTELAELATIPAALKEQAFFNCWTRKEAFVKAIGLGLSFPLQRFSVSLAPDQPAALLGVENDPGAGKRWSLTSLNAGPDYSAALVFESMNAGRQCFEWNPHRIT